MALDHCKTRPAHIHAILTGLDRYNPETTSVFQDYVAQQCQEKTFDCYANLALLKLYQFNPHLLSTETTLNILAKALTVFPSPAFSLSLALLPPYTQPFETSTPAPAEDLPKETNDFIESVQKLTRLSTALESAQYAQFWKAYKEDASYADLTTDVAGFEELIRVRVANEVARAFRVVEVEVLKTWLNIDDEAELEKFVADTCSWTVDRSGAAPVANIPPNKENEARGEIKSEKVEVEQFGRVIRRGFEQPA